MNKLGETAVEGMFPSVMSPKNAHGYGQTSKHGRQEDEDIKGWTCLVDGVSLGLIFSYDEGEELLHIPVERGSKIRVHIDVQK